MNTELVPFKRKDLAIELSTTFVEQRDAALDVASLIDQVTTGQQNQVATDVLRDLGTLRRAAVKAHKEIKAPLLKCGRDLDAKLKEAIELLSAEEDRIGNMTGEYVMLEEAKRRSEAALQSAESDKQLHAELASAKSLDDHQRIREEHALIAQLSQPKVDQPIRAEGQSVREVWDVEVIDKLALAAWAIKTNLVHLIEITPRLTAIRELLDKGMMIPGIEAKRVSKVQVR